MKAQTPAPASPHPKPAARQPLLWAALAYGGGIFAGSYIWRPPLWWLITAILLASFARYFLRRRKRMVAVLAIPVFFVVGALTIQICPTHSAADPFPEGEDVVVTAHVIREGTLRYRGGGDVQQRFDVETEEIASENQVLPSRLGIRASFYGREAASGAALDPAVFHLFRYGDRLRFPTRLFRPHNFRDPGAFDYQRYLEENGISALASAKITNVELLPGFVGSRAELWRTRIHHSIIQHIQELWPEREAALADAILIGENAFVGRETLTDFQRTGTYHVLVISGLKVAILALLTFWLLRRFGLSELASSAITVLLTVAYALVTNVGVPVWRATLMLALYLCAKALYRRKAVVNTIGAVGLGLLLVDPKALFGASFQLSFLCVLIITAAGTPLLERSTQPLRSALSHLDSAGYDFALSPELVQFRLDLRLVAGRLSRFLGGRASLLLLAWSGRWLLLGSEFLVISIVLQLGFALPMAYYFHRATIVSLPANVLAVPLTEIAMVACLFAIAISYASLSLAALPAAMGGISLRTIAGSVRWLGALRIADTRVATPGLWLILVASTALALAMVLVRRRKWLATAGLSFLTACAAWICAVPPHAQVQPAVLEVTTIDVGEGDSILLVSPQGRTLLVDGGGIPRWMHSEMDIGEDVVSPYLWSRGIHQLDAVAVTHPHADHIGGMRAVMTNFHPRELWLGAGPSNSELEALLQEASDLGVPAVFHGAGDGWAWGGLAFRALAPARNSASRKTNDDSLVMKVAYGHTAALLEGDAEKDVEKRIAWQQPDADLLKIAHHGSATSTIPELLAAVHPRFAVISAGRHNVYGHPRIEVLQRLGQAHIKTYRTDLDGAVTFYLDGRTVTSHLAGLQ